MNQPRTCGGGCCSSVVVDKPIPPSNPVMAPAPVEEDRGCGDAKDMCCTIPEPQGTSATKPETNSDLVKPSCVAPCCGGKAGNEEEVLSKLSSAIPILPVSGPPVDSDSSGSPGPSSCQATICDDKCGHGHIAINLGPKGELIDPSTPGRRKLALIIQGMDCPGCSPRVVRALTSFSSVADCHVNVFAGRATMTYHPDKARPDKMARHVVASTGFQCQVEDDQIIGKEMRRMRVQLGRPLAGEHPKIDGFTVIEEASSGLIEVEYETDVNPRDVLASFLSWV